MNTTSAVSFQCFSPKQVKEINKEIKKNILQPEDLSAKAATIKKG